MRTTKQTTENKFLNIKEVWDADTHCRGYQFAERRGVDSVAFICWDYNRGKFLLNKEFTPPTGEFLFRAFGGSMDKKATREEIVLEEVKEEVGYAVAMANIYPLGNAFVSTQMNQRCYLFLVDISNVKETGREPENEMEKISCPVSKTMKEIYEGDDWKAITIIVKAMTVNAFKITDWFMNSGI